VGIWGGRPLLNSHTQGGKKLVAQPICLGSHLGGWKGRGFFREGSLLRISVTGGKGGAEHLLTGDKGRRGWCKTWLRGAGRK